MRPTTSFPKAVKISLITIILSAGLSSCNPTAQQIDSTAKQQQKEEVAIKVPVFKADSAYAFVVKQLSFGPRVPGSEAHIACANWLSEKLSAYADTLYQQRFRTRVYDRRSFDGVNLIGSFNKDAKRRIVLAAHWDSRPYADHDDNSDNHRTPIDGANDGASGVGILIELARLLAENPIEKKLGIDIVLFDLEDYGPATQERNQYSEDTWALGSQYWAKTPHIPGYQAQFGILMDMVGASDPVFPREYFSQQYASWVLDKVWRKAFDLGYGSYFVNKPGSPISDDHVPMNEIAGIPTINIIHLDPNSVNGTFFEHWHTVGDNLDAIDKETLRIVGEVVTSVIYHEQ
ncbi:MAG: M28 family peptidase [Bacteroidales bacterium]|jgi:Zn-dependent M28 family amino/carboxypeptidase|nr:M28 family peptidase [Bacteroidales bacterium]